MIVPGDGPIPCVGLVLGEAPGRDEIAQGRPFVGLSGRFLRNTLASHGLPRGAVYYTNTFKGDVGEGNPDPTPEQIKEHRAMLWGELFEVSPKVILAVGSVAAKAVCGDDLRITRDRGIEHRLDCAWMDDPVLIIPTFHPAYACSYNHQAIEPFNEDCRSFVTAFHRLSRS